MTRRRNYRLQRIASRPRIEAHGLNVGAGAEGGIKRQRAGGGNTRIGRVDGVQVVGIGQVQGAGAGEREPGGGETVPSVPTLFAAPVAVRIV